MIVKTQNSVYQIDKDKKRIRRLTGEADPTPRQGLDKEWKEYSEITDPVKGRPLLVVWEYDKECEVARTTMTSSILSIEKTDDFGIS